MDTATSRLQSSCLPDSIGLQYDWLAFGMSRVQTGLHSGSGCSILTTVYVHCELTCTEVS